MKKQTKITVHEYTTTQYTTVCDSCNIDSQDEYEECIVCGNDLCTKCAYYMEMYSSTVTVCPGCCKTGLYHKNKIEGWHAEIEHEYYVWSKSVKSYKEKRKKNDT